MKQLGIMNGNGDGTFRPDSELSMQEFAVMAKNVTQWGKQKAILASENWRDNAIDIEDFTPEEIVRIEEDYRKRIEEGFAPPVNSTPKNFADSNQIASWAKPAVDEFSRWGILEGDSSGSNAHLNPTQPLSKTRFLVFMFKFEQKLKLFVDGSSPIF
jgi:hypothetical protein